MTSRLKNWLNSGQTKGKSQVEQFFASRSEFSDDAFYAAYFDASGIDKGVVIGVRDEFIKWLPFDMRKLAPDDSFKGDLNFVWHYDSMADVELLCAIEKRFGVDISDKEARDAASMGDLIRLVQTKVALLMPNQSTDPVP